MLPMTDSSQGGRSRRYFTQQMSLLGTVAGVEAANGAFTLRCRSGENFRIKVGPTTWFTALKNMDDLDRDRVPNPKDYDSSKLSDQLRKYVRENDLIAVEGVEI